MPAPQTYKNHSRYDPLFHFFLVPMLSLNVVTAFFHLYRHHHENPDATTWWVILSFVFLAMAANARFSAVRVQNRVIRLEERLRLTALLPSADQALIHSLTTGQLIALRFASDAELPALSRRVQAENLTSKQIKQAIVTWRPDHQRV